MQRKQGTKQRAPWYTSSSGPRTRATWSRWTVSCFGHMRVAQATTLSASAVRSTASTHSRASPAAIGPRPAGRPSDLGARSAVEARRGRGRGRARAGAPRGRPAGGARGGKTTAADRRGGGTTAAAAAAPGQTLGGLLLLLGWRWEKGEEVHGASKLQCSHGQCTSLGCSVCDGGLC